MDDSIHLLVHRLAQCLLFGTSFYFLILCPHSKVEESFQLQATHDLYYNGLFSESYDHLHYPGVVPRSFVGPSILVVFCHIITTILSPFIDWNPLQVQFLSRFVLLILVLWGWFRLANAIGSWKGTYLLLVTAVQFHMPFYASRMLPNTFALAVILHAYASYLSRNIERAAVGLVIATSIFRCDVLLLLFSFGLNWLIRNQLTILGALQLGIGTGAICLFFTVILDSHLWRYWVWPEGVVFYYNTVLGKSSDWGTSPWHFYFTSAIPKAMLITIFLVPMSIVRIPEKLVSLASNLLRRQKSSDTAATNAWLDATSYQTMEYLIPTICFIALYSFLGHKEVRFLFPAFPLLNLAAATGLERFHNLAFGRANAKDKPNLRTERKLGRFLYVAVVTSCLLLTLMASLTFAHISKHNYPGGHAMRSLKDHLSMNKGQIYKVHIDVASAMTGVSLFEQRAFPSVIFDKAGYEKQAFSRGKDQYTHLLSEDAEVAGFQILSTSPGRPRLDLRRRQIVTEDAIYILGRI